MKKPMSQMALFWKSHRQVSDANETFLSMVESGMTKSELEALIRKRPALWGRFSNWLGKLP
jgi:hypothetical protein